MRRLQWSLLIGLPLCGAAAALVWIIPFADPGAAGRGGLLNLMGWLHLVAFSAANALGIFLAWPGKVPRPNLTDVFAGLVVAMSVVGVASQYAAIFAISALSLDPRQAAPILGPLTAMLTGCAILLGASLAFRDIRRPLNFAIIAVAGGARSLIRLALAMPIVHPEWAGIQNYYLIASMEADALFGACLAYFFSAALARRVMPPSASDGLSELQAVSESARERAGASYVGQYWRGEIPLAASFWLDTVALTLIVVFLTVSFQGDVSAEFRQEPGIAVSLIAGGFFVGFCVFVWSLVGLWRSARSYKGWRLWAILARVATVVSVGSFGAIWIESTQTLVETYYNCTTGRDFGEIAKFFSLGPCEVAYYPKHGLVVRRLERPGSFQIPMKDPFE